MRIDARSGVVSLPVRAVLALALSVVLIAGALAIASRPALALSEIKREDFPSSRQTPTEPSDQPIEKETLPPIDQVPIPDATTAPPASDEPGDPAVPDEPAVPDDQTAPDDGSQIDPNAPLPEIFYDLAKLPQPVRQKHQAIVDACKTGDVEKLRPLLDTGDNGTQLSFGGVDGDPITYLKELSGDDGGQEILAILEEVLSAGYVHLDAGTPNEMYVWPYFIAIPLDRLTAAQRVELFKIVTAGDYEDMKNYGSYIFYRVGITPEGKWSFFVAGD